MNQPTNILMVVSDPLDAPISIQSDLFELSDALRNLDAAARFNVMAAEADAVQEHLERGDRQRYSVLHYLGHGYRPAQAQDGFLVFEDIGGMANLLDVARLNYTLAGAAAEFKVTVISACHSESVADALFAVGVDFVVAIEGDQTVYEVAAIAFCRRFYQSLLTGNTIDRAFDAGRRAIFVDEAMRGFDDHVTKDEVAKFKLLSRR